MVSAVTARKNNPNKSIKLVRDKEKGVIPCGIPYIFRRLDSADQDILTDKPLKVNDIDLEIDKASEIDNENKSVEFESGRKIGYDKLILATGSDPSLVPIDGIEKEGVWLVKKDLDYLRKLRKEVLSSDHIVIIGGGFIGVEIAEELSAIEGLEVSIVERSDHCLGKSFDSEFAEIFEESLEEKGVEILTGTTVEKVEGEDRVESVKLETGERLKSDLVILSIGAKPNTELAETAGIKIGDYGAIHTDEYMRTNVQDVFAVGDCARLGIFLQEDIFL